MLHNEQETTMAQSKSKRTEAEGRASGYIRDAAEAAKDGVSRARDYRVMTRTPTY
jgi:hypothetical protein